MGTQPSGTYSEVLETRPLLRQSQAALKRDLSLGRVIRKGCRACCQTLGVTCYLCQLGFDYRLSGVCVAPAGLGLAVTVAQAWGPAGPLGGSPSADPQPTFIPLGGHSWS